jgi:hypothetical protein
MEALHFVIPFLVVPAITFLVGLFLPHVQKSLTDYRQTLTDISQKMLCSVRVIYADPPLPTLRSQGSANSESQKFYDDIRNLHARLLSSADSIPRFARPVLQALGLLRPRAQIEEGAKMLIGISNQVMSANKDLPHLTELTNKLGTALGITV